MVGPSRIEYGCVAAAGTILRRDALQADRLLVSRSPRADGAVPYGKNTYRAVGRTVLNCLTYVGNVLALREWYLNVRQPRVVTAHGAACVSGAVASLNLVIEERIRRLGQLADKLSGSVDVLRAGGPSAELAAQEMYLTNWPAIEEKLRSESGIVSSESRRDAFLDDLSGIGSADSHLQLVGALTDGAQSRGSAWLQAIVDWAAALWT